MGKLAEEIALASNDFEPVWDDQRSARLLSSIRIRQRRRVQVQRAVSALAVVAVIGGGVFFARSSTLGSASAPAIASKEPAPSNEPAPAAAEQPVQGTIREGHTIRLLDGSRAQLFGAQSELAITRNDRNRVSLRLAQGRAHFDVVPNAARSFEVEAAPYRVVVLGTVFDVERSSEHVAVSVERGRVRVYGPQGAEDLLPGQSKRFAMAAGSAAEKQTELEPAPAHEPVEIERERASTRPARRTNDTIPSWRSLTQSGDYDAAFESLRRSRVVQNDPAELMDAADAARLSGHPEDAVGYLERVVKGHRKSPVAPLAAFTLGREYLDRLGQPHKAAEAFELSRKLAPVGSLAQDALAREVEALSKGGNAQKAYLRAREYIAAYPNGRRLRAVQLYGGIASE
jgi:transmembrane sensor